MLAGVTETLAFTLQPERPYSLSRTAERLVHYDDLLERYDANTDRLQRLLPVGRQLIHLEVSQLGSPAQAKLRVRLSGSGARETSARVSAEAYVGRALGARQKISGFYRRFREDPILGPAMRRERGLRVAGNASAFEALVTSILAQQINLKFAYSIRRELTLAFGRSTRIEGERYWSFPTPQKMAGIAEDELRGMRISGAKARAIHSSAAAFKTGAFREAALEEKDDQAILEQLTALRGVGPWTAEQVLMRALGRPDVFPASDLGVIKSLAQELLGHKKTASEKQMRAFSEGWRPYRSLALIYAYSELTHRRRA